MKCLKILVFMFVVLICGCNSEDSPFLSVDQANIEVQNTASSVALSISASGNWTASVIATWVSLSTSSGSGNGTISIEVDPNQVIESRSAEIVIQSDDVPAPIIVVVNQVAGDPFLRVSRTQVTFAPPESFTDTLRIITNTPWAISGNQPWLTLTPSSGTGDATIILNATSNLGLTKREATLTITNSGLNPSQSVLIRQNPRVVIVAGGNGIGANLNQLHLPSSVCVDSQGVIYVTDQFNNRVVKWVANASQGAIVAGGNGSGVSLNQLNSPYGIFVHSNGNLYIGDNVNHRVVKWIQGATTGVLVAGGNGFGSNPNQTSSPTGVYLDASDNLYVSEISVNRVAKWNAGANTGTLIAEGASISFTLALSLDADGNVYIASGNNSTVTKWAPGAVQGIVVAGGNGRGSDLNQLNAPSGVFVDNTGTIFIVEQSNNRVVKWLPGASNGIVVAGGNGSGSGLDQLNSPSGLWIDAAGNIYVADQGNHRVVKWLK